MKEGNTLSRLSNAFTLENRYKSDFEEIGKIGKGGFASVYKVRNLVDMNEYAIKKISVNVADKKAKNVQKEIESVLKEIRCLAKIKNDNIVNYNHSWIEVVLKEQNIDNISIKKEDQKEELSEREEGHSESNFEKESFYLSCEDSSIQNSIEFLGAKCSQNESFDVIEHHPDSKNFPTRMLSISDNSQKLFINNKCYK
jgi:hypothetical protein